MIPPSRRDRIGEYYHGHKLGTTEDLGYVRYDELAAVPDQAVRDYLMPDAFRFRFPWPDEDGQTLAAADGRRMDQTLVVYGSGIRGLHHDVRVPIEGSRIGGVNVFTPCPLSGTLTLRHSPLPDSEPVAILAEKQAANGTRYTVFGCPLCRSAWSTDEEPVLLR